MSVYLWGITYARPSRSEAALRRRAAKAEGADYIEINVRPGEDPGVNGGRYQAWYSGPNLGAPYDCALAEGVAARLAALGGASAPSEAEDGCRCRECYDPREARE